jgi:hypothetical protein
MNRSISEGNSGWLWSLHRPEIWTSNSTTKFIIVENWVIDTHGTHWGFLESLQEMVTGFAEFEEPG